MSHKNKINNFLFSKGFELISENTSEYFGNFYCIYSNNIINVKLVSDRSIEAIYVCSMLDTNRWIDLALIKALIYNEEDLLKIITINEYNDFLEKNLSEICELLNKSNYYSIKKKIEKMEEKKIKQMFPNI